MRRLAEDNLGQFAVYSGKSAIPISEKYMLTIKEASEYFNIGIKNMRRLAKQNTGFYAVF